MANKAKEKNKKVVQAGKLKGTKDERFDFNEEIVIGLKRIDEGAEKKKRKEAASNEKRERKKSKKQADEKILVEDIYSKQEQNRKKEKKEKSQKTRKKAHTKATISEKKKTSCFEIIKMDNPCLSYYRGRYFLPIITSI